MDFVKRYVDDYNKGVQIGNATVQLQAQASITDAKRNAEEQFNNDMISGNYIGAMSRAKNAMGSVFEKYLSDGNVAPAVKDNTPGHEKKENRRVMFTDRELFIRQIN